MSEQLYRVRVLVTDGRPGLIPFTFDLPADNRDQAVKIVRKRVRDRSLDQHRVRKIQSARRMWTGRRGQYPDPYDNGEVH
jgi:hypothetical protein